jgi:hypothetical protein
MAESAISPGELFKSVKAVTIKQLERKPNDKFFVFSRSNYSKEIIKNLSSVKLDSTYKTYLKDLVLFMDKKCDTKRIMQSFDTNKDKIDVDEVKKYFGEVIGPLFILQKNTNYRNVIFPVRSNYELFDFFIQDNKGIYHGFSSKVEGGTSNTLSPKEIEARISKLKVTQPNEKLAAQVIDNFTNEPTLKGILSSAGLLVKQNKLPSKVSNKLKDVLKKINFDADSAKVESNKNSALSKINLSNYSAHQRFLNEYILPRLKSITEKERKDYLSGKKEYNAVNLAYGYGLLIVDANSDDIFDISGLVKKCFQDLNVVKLGIKNGVPSFTLKNVSESKDKYYFRSKHRFSKIKDKLGVQL